MLHLVILGCSFHHCHELLEVDLSVAVLVNFSQCLVNGIFRYKIGHVITREKCYHFLAVNFSALVLIEHVEGCLEVVLSKINLIIHSSCNEFRVIYVSRAVSVGSFNNIKKFFLVSMTFQSFFKLVERQCSTSIRIQLLEQLTELFDLGGRHLRTHGHHSYLLHFIVLIVRFEPLKSLGAKRNRLRLLLTLERLPKPLMLQSLLCGEPLFRFAYQFLYQILGFL